MIELRVGDYNTQSFVTDGALTFESMKTKLRCMVQGFSSTTGEMFFSIKTESGKLYGGRFSVSDRYKLCKYFQRESFLSKQKEQLGF